MATSGAANMRALARRLEAVPDAAVADLVRWFVPRSEAVGGRMRWFGRNVQLSSRLKKRSRRQSTNAEVIVGTPASCWSIKSYGRQGGYDVRPRTRAALKLSAFAPGAYYERVTVQRSTAGDGRWDRLVLEADDKFPDVVADHINRRVIV